MGEGSRTGWQWASLVVGVCKGQGLCRRKAGAVGRTKPEEEGQE